MKRFLSWTSLTLVLAVLNLRCADPKRKQIPGEYTKMVPISSVSPKEQAWGQAVGLVRLAEGGGGTGFFISKDGLFLTSYRLLPRTRCSNERCAGVQIIRNFHQTNDPKQKQVFEVFNNITLIAHNQDLDYALIQVAVEKTKVPVRPKTALLPLSKVANPNLMNRRLRIVGHPLLAPAHIIGAVLDPSSTRKIYQLTTTAVWGTAGSPVIDLQTGEVVALFKGGVKNGEKYDPKTGDFLPNDGMAIPIQQIRGDLEEAFEGLSAKETWTSGDFGKPIAEKEDTLPGTGDQIRKDKTKTIEGLVGQYLRNVGADEGFKDYMNYLKKRRTYLKANADEILDQLVSVDLAADHVLPIAGIPELEDVLKEIEKTSNDRQEVKESVWRFKSRTLRMQAKDCLVEAEIMKLPSLALKLRKAGEVCLTDSLGSGKKGQEILPLFFEGWYDSKRHGEYRPHTTSIVGSQARISTLADEHGFEAVTKSLDALVSITKSAPSRPAALEAQRLWTFIQQDAKQLSPGAFQKTFE